MKVLPAIISVPVLDILLVLAATVKTTVRLPVPLTPDVIVIQLALLVAAQLQVLEEV